MIRIKRPHNTESPQKYTSKKKLQENENQQNQPSHQSHKIVLKKS